MGGKRGKTKQKSSTRSKKPFGKPGSAAQTPTIASSYITRKINKPVISTKSLFSHPNLSEGITIRYTKNDDILTLMQEAYPSVLSNSIDRLWRAMVIFPCFSTTTNTIISVDESTHSNITCNGLCLFNDEGQKISAYRIHSATSNMAQNWIMFVAYDVVQEYVNMFSEYNFSKHFLHFEEGVLRWTESRGNVDVIRRHIDNTESTSFVLDNLSDLKDRLVVLCAWSGTGKSTLIDCLANQAKRDQPDLMVLIISLRDHTQLLDSGIANQPIDFLKKAAGFVSPSEISSFESALKMGRVCVLFDNLDELSPLYLEECCELFQGLHRPIFKLVLVVIGKEHKKYVEDKLSTLAIDLCEFSKEDQIGALRNSWTKMVSNKIDENLLEMVTSKLLEALSLGVTDIERTFVGIPLQKQMVEEVFFNLVCGLGNFSDIPDKLKLVELFDRYCNMKCNPESFKNYKLAALYLILDKENHAEILRYENAEEHFEEFLQSIKSGQDDNDIINGFCNGKPSFRHSVFVDYFAAKWFASCHSTFGNLSDLLFRPELKKTRFIFNRILAKDCHLHTSVLDDNLEDVKTLLGTAADVNARDLGGRTALHLAATLGVTNERKVTVARNEILDQLLCFGTNFEQEGCILGASPLHYAYRTHTWSAMEKLLPFFTASVHSELESFSVQDQQMLEYIVENDLGLLMSLCFKCGFVLVNTQDICKQLLPVSSKLGSTRVASVLIKNGANIGITYGEAESPIHLATFFGHIDIVRLLVEASKDVRNSLLQAFSSDLPFCGKVPSVKTYINLRNGFGETALQLAISFSQLDIVEYLLQEKAGMSETNLQIHRAVANTKCNAQIVVAVLNEIAPENRKQCVNSIVSGDGSSSVHTAATTGNVEMVRYLLDAGGSATKQKFNGRTPLMVAAWWGHLDMVKFLLQRIPQNKRMREINNLDEDGQTALKLTTHYGHADVVAYLLEQNADKGELCELINFAGGNMKGDARVVELILSVIPVHDRVHCINSFADLSNSGYTAVNSAAKMGNLKGLEMLIRAGGSITIPNDEGRTPLMEAASIGHLDIVRLLAESAVKQGVSKRGYINKSDGALTALLYAILGGHLDVINYLFKEKADMGDCFCALMIAVVNAKGDAKVVDAVFGHISTASKKKCLNESDKLGNTVMHLAARSGSLDMIVRFVENGSKISTVNNSQTTPLMIAASKGHILVVVYLLDKFDEKTEGMKKMQYINMRDRDGLNAVSLANKSGQEAVMVYITHALDKLLDAFL